MDADLLKKLPIMGILRGITPAMVSPLCETICLSGLETIEIAMNSEGAPELVRKMKEAAGNRLTVGAGTVLSMDTLHAALDAGARFIVMPVLVKEIMAYCRENNIPVFPGALTPQEIYDAWRAGATMVKVFPAKFFGPCYLREIKAPFREIALLACGGVREDNVKTYFSNGASAVAFGEGVFRKEWLEKGEFDKIRQAIVKLIYACRSLNHVS